MSASSCAGPEADLPLSRRFPAGLSRASAAGEAERVSCSFQSPCPAACSAPVRWAAPKQPFTWTFPPTPPGSGGGTGAHRCFLVVSPDPPPPPPLPLNHLVCLHTDVSGFSQVLLRREVSSSPWLRNCAAGAQTVSRAQGSPRSRCGDHQVPTSDGWRGGDDWRSPGRSSAAAPRGWAAARQTWSAPEGALGRAHPGAVGAAAGASGSGEEAGGGWRACLALR